MVRYSCNQAIFTVINGRYDKTYIGPFLCQHFMGCSTVVKNVNHVGT